MTAQYLRKRCRVITAAREPRTGAPLQGRTGTIRSQTENLGRTLLLVEWDHTTAVSYVFPTDIELIEDAVQSHHAGAS